MPRGTSCRLGTRIGVCLLILVFTGLSVQARQNEYLPKSNPAHYLSIATKVKVNHALAYRVPAQLDAVALVLPPEPQFHSFLPVVFVKPHLRQIGLTVSLQHRSPPSIC
jgi:hypothetical protein